MPSYPKKNPPGNVCRKWLKFLEIPGNLYFQKTSEKWLNPIQPGVPVHGTSPGGGKSYPPYKFSIKTVQMAIKFML